MLLFSIFNTLYHNVYLSFTAGLEVKIMIDVDTFYLNEKTTIQCTASEETIRLELVTSIGGVEKETGCINAGGWASRDNIFSQSLITDSDCTTAAQSPPFIITLQPSVTEQLNGSHFWCRAYDSAKTTNINTAAEKIKGEIFK